MSPRLRSLDLFSGLGGITIALEGICKPVAYCEIDPLCREILATKMKKGTLPRAPIFEDVKALTAKKLSESLSSPPRIDIIVGGWPCQDLSAMGKQKGLKGPRSGLIYEVLRLTDELQPSMLFLENVPPLTMNGLGDIIKEFVLDPRRNYELRWAVVPASSIGTHHSRKRWYGLLVKEGTPATSFAHLSAHHTVFRWAAKEPVPRMVIPRNPTQKKQMLEYTSRLGNSVVPDAVRAAFVVLASAFAKTPDSVRTLTSLALVPRVPATPARKTALLSSSTTKYPPWGYATPSGPSYTVSPPHMAVPALKLVLDPNAYKGHSTGPVSSELVTSPMMMRSWSTPRFSSTMCHVLTQRSARDLPTQARFERSTPAHLRKGIINPAFVEWLMGYMPMV